MLKLKNLGSAMSREQMKNVNGGNAANYSCTFTYVDGSSTVVTYHGTGAEAQCAADHACCGNNNCTNADCQGSGAC